MSNGVNKEEQIQELLDRGVNEAIDHKHLADALHSKKKLRVKLGIDPTSPNLHIGRAVVLWKLRAFQELGHQVVLIVGDFTGLIGDTSDKDSERPMLSEQEVKANMKTYFGQSFKVLDKKKTEIHYNSEWLKQLGFVELAQMANLFGLHEFSARENISKRMQTGKRVSLRELLYPLMQGYDSVAVKADVELGGTDQRFNLLAGRTIQPLYKQAPQDILMTELMEGTDGRKMSSSWGNVINLTDEANDMLGKVMSIPDALIKKYFVLATRVPLPEIDEIVKLPNPRDQKLILAEKITELYHGSEKAAEAKNHFINQFSKGELPTDIATKKMKPGSYNLVDLLVDTGLVASKSESRRLLQQKGVKVNQVTAADEKIVLDGKTEVLLQVGKRKFIKLR